MMKVVCGMFYRGEFDCPGRMFVLMGLMKTERLI